MVNRLGGGSARPGALKSVFLFPVSSFIFRERKQRPRRAQTETLPEKHRKSEDKVGKTTVPSWCTVALPAIPSWCIGAIPSWLIARGRDPILVDLPPQTPAGFIDPLVVNLSCGRS